MLTDVHGLATVGTITYKDRQFSRMLDQRIERDNSTIQIDHGFPRREFVKSVAEKIYAMLSVDDEPFSGLLVPCMVSWLVSRSLASH